MKRFSVSRLRKVSESPIWRRLSLESLETRFAMDGSSDSSGLVPSDGELGNGSVGVVEQASVASARMAFRIELTDLQDRPITTIQMEDEFYLKVYVEDLRALSKNALSIFSAYVDIGVDWNRFSLTARPRLGSDFWDDDVRWATTQPLVYQELLESFGGVFIQRRELGTPLLLALIPLRAIAVGETEITLGAVENRTGVPRVSELYGESEPLKAEEIDFGLKKLTAIPKGSTSIGGGEVGSGSSGGQTENPVPWVPPTVVTQPVVISPVVIPPVVIPPAVVPPVVIPTVAPPAPVVPAALTGVSPSNDSDAASDVPSPSSPVEVRLPKSSLVGSLDEEGSDDRAGVYLASISGHGDRSRSSWDTYENVVASWYARVDGARFLMVVGRSIALPIDGLRTFAELGVQNGKVVRASKDGESPLTLRGPHIGLREERVLASLIEMSAMEKGVRWSASTESGSPLRSQMLGGRVDWRSENRLHGVANDVVSRILERVEWVPLSKEQTRAFEWEATYTRRLIDRIPLLDPESDSERSKEVRRGRDGYVDLGLPIRAMSDWQTRPEMPKRDSLIGTGSEMRRRVAFPFAFEGGSLPRLAFEAPTERAEGDAMRIAADGHSGNAVGDMEEIAGKVALFLGESEASVDERVERNAFAGTSPGSHWGSWGLAGVASLGWLLLYGREDEESAKRWRESAEAVRGRWTGWARWNSGARRARG